MDDKTHIGTVIDPPKISTRRLVLRPLSIDDAENVAKLAGDAEIAATTLLIPHPYHLQDAVDWISSHPDGFSSGKSAIFAITMGDSGELVGAIGLMIERDHQRAEVGYWIGKEYWGRGIATEACKAIVDYGFTILGLNRIYAHHFVHNPSSGRVMTKAGMKHEGTLRQHVIKNDRFVDCVFYGLCRSEWQSDVSDA